METIKFIFGIIFAAIGGLFIGQVASLLSMVIIESTREILGEKIGSKLIVWIVFVSFYLIPLIYIGDMLLENWHLLIGASISYIYLMHLVYISDGK